MTNDCSRDDSPFIRLNVTSSSFGRHDALTTVNTMCKLVEIDSTESQQNVVHSFYSKSFHKNCCNLKRAFCICENSVGFDQ